jgi:iron-sulfur cluster repair protein YtfE (RIC family)
MMSPDPVQTFEHDHVRCSNLVRALDEHAEVLRRKRFSGKQLFALIEQLRDELFTHFAREEEGLFPFIVQHVPEASRTVDRLVAAHDAICGSLSRLLLVTSRSDSDGRGVFEELFGRFNVLYREHACTEVTLLREIGDRLDGGQRAKLQLLVSGL